MHSHAHRGVTTMGDDDLSLIRREVYEMENGIEVQVRHANPDSGERLYVQTRKDGNAVNDVFRVTDRDQQFCKYISRQGKGSPSDTAVAGVHNYGYQIQNVDVDIEISYIGSGKLGNVIGPGDGDEDIHIVVPDTPTAMGRGMDALDAVMEYWRTDGAMKTDPLVAKLFEFGQAYVATAHQVYTSPDAREQLEAGTFADRYADLPDKTMRRATKMAQVLYDAGLEPTSGLDQAKRRERAAEGAVEDVLERGGEPPKTETYGDAIDAQRRKHEESGGE